MKCESPSVALWIPNWHPATINQLMRSVKAKIRLKKRDRQIIWTYSRGLSMASGKRRVNVTLVMRKGARCPDPDSIQKSLLDALVSAGLLKNDSPKWVELAPVQYERSNTERWGTMIKMEDLPNG